MYEKYFVFYRHSVSLLLYACILSVHVYCQPNCTYSSPPLQGTHHLDLFYCHSKCVPHCHICFYSSLFWSLYSQSIGIMFLPSIQDITFPLNVMFLNTVWCFVVENILHLFIHLREILITGLSNLICASSMNSVLFHRAFNTQFILNDCHDKFMV